MTILLSLMLLVLTASCQSDETYTDVVPEVIFPDDTPKEQVIYANETDSAKTISFQSNYTWRVYVYDVTSRNVENDTGWLHVSQYGGGRGNFDLKLTTKVNETGKDRKAEIVLLCGDKYTFTLTQKGTPREK